MPECERCGQEVIVDGDLCLECERYIVPPEPIGKSREDDRESEEWEEFESDED